MTILLKAMFRINKRSNKTRARQGLLKTAHGVVKTPFFMSIASKGAVKTLTTNELASLGAQIVLSNTYHLMLKPGQKTVARAGGLHKFMNWAGPILTDSGGYQVFSLAKNRKITEKGVVFADPKSGQKYELTPEKAIKIQKELGVDIMIVLDECAPHPCNYKYAKESMEMTSRWAKRCLRIKNQEPRSKIQKRAKYQISKTKPQLLFCIVQGSTYKDLRLKSVEDLKKMDFDGYAIGGLAVGEGTKKMLEVLDYTAPVLPESKPRYLMGVGRPEEIVEAVKRGVDMFDCVIPTREGRHAKLFIRNEKVKLGRKDFYKSVNILNRKFATDFKPINENSKVQELKNLSKAYLHHLFKVQEPLAQRLASLNNLEFYLNLMQEIRGNIRRGEL